jgi:hypothetical protein
MPHCKTSPHPRIPGLSITFAEADHTYTDTDGMRYESATAIVKRYCQPFNAVEISRAKAFRDADRTAADWERLADEQAARYRAEWDEKRDQAASRGTRAHETAEAIIKGEPPPHTPQDAAERAAFAAVWEYLAEMRAARPHLALYPEIVLFSPGLYLAGTADLLVYNPQWQELEILDWKTNAMITDQGFNGQTMAPPVAHLQDANQVHYALQLSLYRRILAREGYFDHLGPIKAISQALLWIAPGAGRIERIPVPYLAHETAEMLLERAANATPF